MPQSPNLEDEPNSSVLQLGTFSLEVFQIMCVLSGCDFLNIKNFGIKSAYKLCRKYHNTDRIIRYDGGGGGKGRTKSSI